MSQETPSREQWNSRLGFILAATGSAIGLGNIWKFPFVTGEYGGAAFVLVYLICIVVVGFPVMLIEFSMGRHTQRNPVGAYATIAGRKSVWIWAGGLGVLAGFVILSYYSVVAGWCLAYIVKAFSGSFSTYAQPAHAGHAFETFVGQTGWVLFYHFTFMVLCVAIVTRGIRSGIEKASRLLMPTLLLILLLLVIRGLLLPGAGAGLKYLFQPDFSKLSGEAVLVALGHAFFTLSLGMGAMITYGSHIPKRDDLIGSTILVMLLDTGIALLAGIAIFTSVFAYDLDPQGGPGLIFHVLPVVFGKMPMGTLFAVLFFVLLSIAALTSGISLLEVVTSYVVDEKGWDRKIATLVFGGVIFLLGIPSALSFGVWADIKLGEWTLFDFFDYVSFKYMLPLGGFLSILFVLNSWKVNHFLDELKEGSKWTLVRLVNCVLVLVATLIVVVFLSELGFFAWLFGKPQAA